MNEGQLRAAMRAGFKAGERHPQIVDRIIAAQRKATGQRLTRLGVASGYQPLGPKRARARVRGHDVTQDDQ